MTVDAGIHRSAESASGIFHKSDDIVREINEIELNAKRIGRRLSRVGREKRTRETQGLNLRSGAFENAYRELTVEPAAHQ